MRTKRQLRDGVSIVCETYEVGGRWVCRGYLTIDGVEENLSCRASHVVSIDAYRDFMGVCLARVRFEQHWKDAGWKTGCDACSKPATQLLDSETSPHCANWFIGHYCGECFALVDKAMKEEHADG